MDLRESAREDFRRVRLSGVGTEGWRPAGRSMRRTEAP